VIRSGTPQRKPPSDPHAAALARGNVKVIVVPLVLSLSAQMHPPCASMANRQKSQPEAAAVASRATGDELLEDAWPK